MANTPDPILSTLEKMTTEGSKGTTGLTIPHPTITDLTLTYGKGYKTAQRKTRTRNGLPTHGTTRLHKTDDATGNYDPTGTIWGTTDGRLLITPTGMMDDDGIPPFILSSTILTPTRDHGPFTIHLRTTTRDGWTILGTSPDWDLPTALFPLLISTLRDYLGMTDKDRKGRDFPTYLFDRITSSIPTDDGDDGDTT